MAFFLSANCIEKTAVGLELFLFAVFCLPPVARSSFLLHFPREFAII